MSFFPPLLSLLADPRQTHAARRLAQPHLKPRRITLTPNQIIHEVTERFFDEFLRSEGEKIEGSRIGWIVKRALKGAERVEKGRGIKQVLQEG